ncbi:MAG: hypothetical protein MUE85_13450 [Microscillaceae bacterium]|jgi:hypothetical protein|nr:hypothetical protein [Microscillaceae bacterium]
MTFFTRQRLYLYSIILLIISLLATAGVWYWQTRRPLDAWNLMPANPICIFETHDLPQALPKLQATALWQTLAETPFVATLTERAMSGGGILQELGVFPSFLTNRKITISWHLTAKSDFDLLYFVPFAGENDEKIWQKIENKFQQNPDYQFFKRNYRGYDIHEVSHPSLEQRFSFVWAKGFWVASFSPILVEDVVRKLAEGERAFAFVNQREMDKLAQAPAQTAHFLVYFNPKQLNEFLKISVKENLSSYFKPLNYFADGAWLEMKANKQNLDFQGFSFSIARDSASFLNIWQEQTPQVFGFKNYIPNQTACLFYWGLSDNARFFQNWRAYQGRLQSDFLPLQKDLQIQYGFQIADFYQAIGQEIAFCALAADNGGAMNKLILIRSAQTQSLLKQLQSLSQKVDKQQKSLPSREKSGNIEIFEIKLNDFPARLWGDFAGGFERCYYAMYGQLLVMANDARVIKHWLSDLEKNEVWGKNRLNAHLLQDLGQAANFRVVMNPTRMWSIWQDNAAEKWQKWLQDHETSLKNLHWLSAQFADTDDQKFATRLLCQVQTIDTTTATRAPEGYENLTQTHFKDLIYTPPYLVKNHENDSQELLVQDVANNLALISPKGYVLWKRNISSPLRSVPIQIDIYDNDRLQYLFIGADRLNLIDRVGRNVSPFPLRMVTDSAYLQTFAELEMVEDNKKYYLVSNSRGKAHLFDAKWNHLENWRPKSLNSRLSTPAQTVAIGGSTYILLGQENGEVQAFNRAGQARAGFPVQVNGRISNPLWIDANATAENTLITCLSAGGDLVKFNLLGKVLEQEQLYRPSGRAQFHLCIDQLKQDWLIGLTDAGVVEILDKKGKKIFEHTTESKADQWEVQYFNFESPGKIIAITDKKGGLTYLYNLKGEKIAEPFPSNRAVQIQYDALNNRLIIFYVNHKKVGSLGLKWRG